MKRGRCLFLHDGMETKIGERERCVVLSTAGLGQNLRTGRPQFGGLSFHDVSGMCTNPLAHWRPGNSSPECVRHCGRCRAGLLLWGRTTACDPHALGGAQCGEQRGPDLKHINPWSGSTRFRILSRRPPQGCSWVDGRLTNTQVTSRPDTIQQEALLSMSECAEKKAMQQWVIEKPKIQAARQKRKIHVVLPDEVEEFDAIVQNAREKLEIPVGPAMPRVTQVRIPTAKTPTQKVAV